MTKENEVVERLNRCVSDMQGWLMKDNASHPIQGAEYVVGLNDVYVEAILDDDGRTSGKVNLHINPLDATRLGLKMGFRLARITHNDDGEQCEVCVLRDAVTKSLRLVKETLDMLKRVEVTLP